MSQYSDPMIVNIETVMDEDCPEDLIPRAEDYEAPSNYRDEAKIQAYKEQRAEADKKALNISPLTGQIVTIGFRRMAPNQQHEPIILYNPNEKELLEAAAEHFGYTVVNSAGSLHLNHQLVTYNGATFDIPYLVHAFQRHRVPVPRALAHAFNQRRGVGLAHVDMFDVLGRKGRLKHWTTRFGLDPIYGDGAFVQQWYDDGKTEDIVKHCLTNVNATWRLYEIYKDILA